MKRVYELDVYKLVEELSDMVCTTLISGTKRFRTPWAIRIIRSSDSIAANIAEAMVGILPLTGKSLSIFKRFTWRNQIMSMKAEFPISIF